MFQIILTLTKKMPFIENIKKLQGVSEEFFRWRKGRQMDREMRKGSGFGVQAGFFLNPDNLNPGFSECPAQLPP